MVLTERRPTGTVRGAARVKALSLFVQTPLDRRDYERFGIPRFLARGFDVEVVDMTRLLNPDYMASYAVPDLSDHPGIVRPGSWEEVGALIAARDRFGIFMVACNERTLPLYRLFKRHGRAYAQFCSNMIPFPTWTLRKLLSLPGRLSGAWLKKKWEMLRFALRPRSAEEAQAPLCVLRGGRKYVKNYPGAEAKTVWAHTLDYDLYLSHREARPAARPYAVFLDEYLPFHPDYIVEKDQAPGLDADAYYAALNRCFADLEKRAGLAVVIAAHPRALYEGGPDRFRGRRCEKGRTVELVRDAELVLAHASTAVNFAALFGKPVAFLTTRKLDASYEGGLLWSMARKFGKRPLGIDGPAGWDWAAERRVDRALYARYIEDYVKLPGTPEKPFWDIVSDFLDAEVFAGAS